MDSLFKIKIVRNVLRCDTNGFISQKDAPFDFNTKSKNRFITLGKDKTSSLKISTPVCDSLIDCFIKFEELTDIVHNELHEIDELIWASSNYDNDGSVDKQNLSSIKINFALNKNTYKIIKEKFENAPKTLPRAYTKLVVRLTAPNSLLIKRFGKVQVQIINTEDSEYLKISHIPINSYSRCGISYRDIRYIMTLIFSELIDEEDLEKVNEAFLIEDNSKIEHSDKKVDYKDINNLSYDEILKLSKEHSENGYNERYRLKHYPKLLAEAACVIKDALLMGIDYKILNEDTSFAKFMYKDHEEFIIEGNRTDRDSYIFPIVTDDKMVSKNIMKDAGLNVPEAYNLNKNMSKLEKDYYLNKYYNKCVVIKPRNTNQGTGITVFKEPATKEQIDDAVKYAFKFDDDVLVEQFIKGMEYRFLVVNGKCVSICHRRAASVVGDGKSTIKQLIELKNKEPWHALTYTPVKTDPPVEEFLNLQGLTYDSVPKKDERIFLRNNSNCSTGGESIDYTYIMPKYFKSIAEKAAHAFKAKVTGVDLIINDMNKKDYSIIEINDDPGYSINEWPYEGKGERVGMSILKLVGFRVDDEKE